MVEKEKKKDEPKTAVFNGKIITIRIPIKGKIEEFMQKIGPKVDLELKVVADPESKTPTILILITKSESDLANLKRNEENDTFMYR